MSYKDILNKKAKEWGCLDMMDSVKDEVPKIPLSSPLLNWLTYGGLPRGRIIELFGEEGSGKAQPLYSKVLTTSGFHQMQDMKIGDEVFDRYGNICKVDGIYPQKSQPIYEIKLEDNSSIRVAQNHLNVVWRYNYYAKRREESVMTTDELIAAFESENGSARYSKWRIDTPSVDWPICSVPLDPYLLGALLGGGRLTDDESIIFTDRDIDTVAKVDSIIRRDWGCYLKQSDTVPCEWVVQNINKCDPGHIELNSIRFGSLSEFKEYLEENNYPALNWKAIYRITRGLAGKLVSRYPELANIRIVYDEPSGSSRLYTLLAKLRLDCKSTERRVPQEYLYNSKDVRLSLLQGLFDTMGRIDPDGQAYWTTSSSKLSESFVFIAQSLGMRDTIKVCHTNFDDKEFRVWTHCLKVPKGVAIYTSSKHSRFHGGYEVLSNCIEDIKYVGNDVCQCLHVTSPDHTYISDDFIPTHNTTTAIDLASHAKELFAAEHESKVQEYREFVAKGKKEYAGPLEDLIDQGPKAVLYVDLEHTFDWAWAGRLGLRKGDIDVAQPGNVGGEQICQMIEDVARTGEVGLIVIDSIPSLVTEAEWTKKYGERTVSSLAGLMTTFMRKMTYVTSQNDCTLVLINQTRDNMDNPYVLQTPGGRAIKFYCTTRLYFRKGAPLDFAGNELPQSAENPAGYKINVKMQKQKGAPFDRKVASYYLMSQTGIRPDYDYAKLAIDKYNIIQKRGAWFSLCDSFTGEILEEEDGRPVKVNGQLKVFDYLADHPDYYAKLRAYIDADINGSEVDMSQFVDESAVHCAIDAGSDEGEA